MARIRSIHPGLFTDEAFVSCGPLARLLAIGLWTEADDQGVFEWKPIMIKMRLFPADSIDVATMLDELATNNLIKKFQSGGREYGAVRNFRKFQRPKKPNSVHPLPHEFRTYVALNASSSELDDDDDTPSGEPKAVKARPVPQKGEIAPQMEDGGWRMEEEPSSKPSSPTTSTGPEQAGTWNRETMDALHDRMVREGNIGMAPVALSSELAPIIGLLDAGFNIDLDVLPGIRRAMSEPDARPTKWKFFVGWIKACRKDRLDAEGQGRASIAAETKTAPPVKQTAENLVKMAKMYLRSGDWQFGLVIEPGRPGTPITPEILDQARAEIAAERKKIVAHHDGEAA